MAGLQSYSRRGLLTTLLAVGTGCLTDSDGLPTDTRTPPPSATPTDEPTVSATTTETTTPTATTEPTQTETAEPLTDVPFRETDERTLELDLYRPSTDDPAPFVLFAHGGGWFGGDKGHRPMFDRLVAEGFAVADVQYRLAQEKQYPAAVRDIVAAVKWLRANAEANGIDADRGALAGYSAGAHLTALVAVAPQYERFQPAGFHPDVPVAVDAFVGYSGPYDFTEAGIGENPLVAGFFGADASEERLREGSPVTHVDGSAPPALLVHGTDDRIVPYRSTEALAEAYRDAGVTVEVVTGEGAGHGMIDNDDWREESLPAQERFLTEHLDSK